MAIKFKALEKTSKNYEAKRYIYKDLSFDLNMQKVLIPGFDKSVTGVDIRDSRDLAAIKNSIQNLINTAPGERFLFPDYGMNLRYFLFSPITESTAYALGETVFSTINTYEPRVSVKSVEVIPDEDNLQYTINIIVNIISLNIQTTIEGVLSTKTLSFNILPTSQLR
jgi:phage baseplate assembly protein W